MAPSAPVRQGKRNVERFPYPITSERYQEMFRKKLARGQRAREEAKKKEREKEKNKKLRKR